MGSPEWILATLGQTVAYVLVLLSPLVLSGVVFGDATKREISRRYTWAGGVLLATVAPVFGAYVVGVLYFLVNWGKGGRVRSTGHLVAAFGVVQAVLVVPYAVLYAVDPLLAILAVLPVVVLYLVWRRAGGDPSRR